MRKTRIEVFYVNGFVKQMPKKKELRLLIMEDICSRLPAQELFSEQEINTYLKTCYADFVEMRRYLIDYQFLTRSKDGSVYQRNDHAHAS